MTHDEWGPWIEHDGSPEAPIGMFAEVTERAISDGVLWSKGDERTGVFLLRDPLPYSWTWEQPPLANSHVIRYRIRKPRGMVVMENLLADLPEKVDA